MAAPPDVMHAPLVPVAVTPRRTSRRPRSGVIGRVRILGLTPSENCAATGRSPRLVAYLDNGSNVAMDAPNCRRDIPSSGGTWARTDITSFLSTDAPCTIYEGATAFSNTPTMTAWQVFAAAHPGKTVTFTFIVADQPGTYYLDRISLGAGKLYGNGNSPSKSCPNEGNC